MPRLVIDLHVRYIGEFTDEFHARCKAMDWAVDSAPEGITISCPSTTVRTEEQYAEDTERGRVIKQRWFDANLNASVGTKSDQITFDE